MRYEEISSYSGFYKYATTLIMFHAPAFEIGIWNAWILLFYHFLLLALVIFFYKGSFKRSSAFLPSNKLEKRIMILWMVIYYLALLYSIFLPLQLGTTWFYLGFPICLFGLIMYTIVWINIITTPLDEPITKGLYCYSRHPLYLITALIFIGVSITSASWVFLLFSIIIIISSVIIAFPKERFYLEKYGNAYQEHLNKTPRWIGIPKSNNRDFLIHFVKMMVKSTYYPFRLLLKFISFLKLATLIKLFIRYWISGTFFFIYMGLLIVGIFKLLNSEGDLISLIYSIFLIFLAFFIGSLSNILDFKFGIKFFIIFMLFGWLLIYFKIDIVVPIFSLIIQGFEDFRLAILIMIFTISLVLILFFITRAYSFRWDKIPGKDNDSFLRYLRNILHISWAENVKIFKSNNGKNIKIFKDENSAEIIIDEKNEIAILKISDGRAYKIEEIYTGDILIHLFFSFIKKIFYFYSTV